MRDEIEASEMCGCFFCLKTFPPDEIKEWVDVGDVTPLCPRCDIDSVLGTKSGFPTTDADFLTQMRNHFFGEETFEEDE